MLSRYQMKRGAKSWELPKGTRQDTRKHTKHVLRPSEAMVTEVLGGQKEWSAFERDYRALLEERFRAERARFDALAEQARHEDVWLGCSCPTQKQPDVHRCHTVLALRFLRAKYPDLEVVLP